MVKDEIVRNKRVVSVQSRNRESHAARSATGELEIQHAYEPTASPLLHGCAGVMQGPPSTWPGPYHLPRSLS